MSRLWTNDLLGVLSPQHIAVVKKTLFGRTAGEGFTQALQADEDDHDSMLETFGQGLSQLAVVGSRLRLVLAGSLARYALTMPVNALLSMEEETGVARQTFVQRYGDASQGWTVRYQVQGLGEPFLCSAVETTLLDKLRMLCQNRKVVLSAVEPLLAIAWRKARRRLPGKAGWLAVTEPGRVHLIALQKNSWVNLASSRTHGDWETVLATLLQREASILERNENETVWLMATEPGLNISKARPWRWLTTPQGDTPYVDFVLG
ncbi:MAG: hypothetical protein WBX11_04145 [Thiobacillaceae bacterium]